MPTLWRVVTRPILGSVLATTLVMTGSARAQTAGDIVIIGSSLEAQAALQAYWEQLLELNAAKNSAPAASQPAPAPAEAQPAADTQEKQPGISDADFEEDFEEDIPEAESEDNDS